MMDARSVLMVEHMVATLTIKTHNSSASVFGEVHTVCHAHVDKSSVEQRDAASQTKSLDVNVTKKSSKVIGS